MALPQIVTYAVVEKGMENKGMLCCNHDASIGAAKNMSWDEAMLNSAEIKPVGL